MSLQARRELVAAVGSRYQQAAKKVKQKILDEFTAATGYHRKYAINLLQQKEPQALLAQRQRKPRSRCYTAEVKTALVRVWEASNRICSIRYPTNLPGSLILDQNCLIIRATWFQNSFREGQLVKMSGSEYVHPSEIPKSLITYDSSSQSSSQRPNPADLPEFFKAMSYYVYLPF